MGGSSRKLTAKSSSRGRRARTRRESAVRGTAKENSPHRPDAERLQKVLAAAGIASRRECESLMLEGRVEVDGEVVSELGTKVDRRKQEIRVDGEPIGKPRTLVFAVHKPPGVVSTTRDPAGRPRVIDLVPPSVGRVFNVGRLDAGSEGLILVTNDGELANLLTHPRHGVEKLYHVTVAGNVAASDLVRLRRGEYLSDGLAKVAHARIKKRHKHSTLLEIGLTEGRNREIRRLLARTGHKVMRLVRVAIGPLRLGDLPRGAARLLERREIAALRRGLSRQTVAPKPTRSKTARSTPPTPTARAKTSRQHRRGGGNRA